MEGTERGLGESSAPSLPRKSRLDLVVLGKPVPWGRTGHGQNGPRFTAPKAAHQMGRVLDEWEKAGSFRFEDKEFLEFGAMFLFPRPNGHYGTGRNEGVLKPGRESLYPTTGKNGGDIDNLVKLVLDALEGHAFKNDARVFRVDAFKGYTESSPLTRIWIEGQV